MSQELVKILTRIYFRMEFDEWDLNENEYKLLDSATGEEIAAIAYNKGFSLQNLIKKADDLIETHNGNVQRKLLRDLKSIKLDLLSDVPRTKHRESVIDTTEIDRRILEEAIDEVASLEPELNEDNPDETDWQDINIEEVLKAKNLLGPSGFAETTTHAEKLIQSVASSSVPQLQRNRNFSGAISIPEVVVTSPDVRTIGNVEDFADPTISEMVDFGMLSGNSARQLYNRINNIESQPPSMLPLLQDPNPDSPGVMNTPQRPDSPMSEFETPGTPMIASTPAVSLMPEKSAQIPVPVAQPAPTSANKSKSISRLQIFEEIAKNTEAQRPKKPQRRQRRPKEPTDMHNDNDEMELNEPLVIHKHRKPKKVRSAQVDVFLNMEMDIFKCLEEFEPDPITEDRQHSPVQQVVEESVPLMELEDIPNYNAPATGTSFIAKKPRLENSEVFNPIDSLDFQIPPPPPDFVQSMTDHARNQNRSNSLVVPEFGSSLPLGTSNLQNSSSAQNVSLTKKNPKRKTLSVEEVEFQHSRYLSQKSVEASQKILENQRQKSAATLGKKQDDECEEGVDDKGRVLYKTFMENGEKKIKFVGAGNKVEVMSEYCAEVIAVYLQIRFLMKKENQWKLSFKKIFSEIELLDKDAPEKELESRLFLLYERKYVKLTFTEDENHILDVEIPVKLK